MPNPSTVEENFLKESQEYLLTSMADTVFFENREKGFWENRDALRNLYPSRENQLELIEAFALITTEASEAIESIRKNLEWKNDKDQHLPHRSNVEVELADIIIRCLDLAGGLGIDLGQVVQEKLDYNKTRPYKHGKTC